MCCRCHDCGEPARSRFAAECQPCRDARDARWAAEDKAKSAAALESANKVETWDSWVYSSQFGGEGEGYFASLDEMVRQLSDSDLKPEEWPEYVHTAKANPFALCIDSAIESAIENSYDDLDPIDLDGMSELAAAVATFNAANAKLVHYEPDYRTAIRVPR